MTAYGAFVKPEEGIHGMVLVSDMSWTHSINHPSEMLKKGEEVGAVAFHNSSPVATWPCRRKALISAPSPQMAMPANHLYQRPAGTSGFEAAQSATRPTWTAVISRSWIRSAKWANSASAATFRYRRLDLRAHTSPNVVRLSASRSQRDRSHRRGVVRSPPTRRRSASDRV